MTWSSRVFPSHHHPWPCNALRPSSLLALLRQGFRQGRDAMRRDAIHVSCARYSAACTTRRLSTRAHAQMITSAATLYASHHPALALPARLSIRDATTVGQCASACQRQSRARLRCHGRAAHYSPLGIAVAWAVASKAPSIKRCLASRLLALHVVRRPAAAEATAAMNGRSSSIIMVLISQRHRLWKRLQATKGNCSVRVLEHLPPPPTQRPTRQPSSIHSTRPRLHSLASVPNLFLDVLTIGQMLRALSFENGH